MMTRPKHLPDFSDPPLNEVVLGIQFQGVPGYSSVSAGDIWTLFKKEFPIVTEQPMLQPEFETFGGFNTQPGFQFQIGPQFGSRLWFISQDSSRLIQFQQDRFLANWRKSQELKPYPRFESIAEAFESNLRLLNSHVSQKFNSVLEINQAEVSYINLIPVDDFALAGEWISILGESKVEMEAVNLNFSEVILDEKKKPVARLHHSIESVLIGDGTKKALRLSLIYRGKPHSTTIEAAVQFLNSGREAIVKRFSEVTSKKAHVRWGRNQ